MATTVVSKCVGLVTQYNSLTVVDGALVQADNAVMRRENVIENRRGYGVYNTNALSAEPLQLMTYRNRILSHLDNDTVVYDNGSGTFALYTGTYNQPSGYKVKAIEANNNLYMTSADGVQVFSDVAGTEARAVGLPRPLNVDLSIYNAGAAVDWLPVGESVAYRVCYTLTDANDNVIRSAPSDYEVIENGGASDESVQLVIYLPEGITTSHVVEVYRTAMITAPDLPPDEMTLVTQFSPSSSDISAGFITYIDSTDPTLIERSLPLYTSESQEGIGQANFQPPQAIDLALYKSNYMFYFNTVQKQTLNLTMVGVEPLGNVFTCSTTSGNPTITVIIGTIGNVKVGDKVVGAGIPVGATISSISAPNITLSANATATSGGVALQFYTSATITIAGDTYSFDATETAASRIVAVDITSSSLSTQIENTAKSLVKCINIGATADLIYAYYVSGPNDLPGQIVLQERSLGGSAFTAQISHSLATSAFFPVLPVSPATSTNTTSSASTNTNYAYFSKYQQFEAVPALNFLPIGPANATILRGFALRDSVVVITDKGIYRISGETAPFSVAAIDLTVYGIAPESWTTLANVAIGLSNQGVVAVSDTSVTVVSREIEPNILPLLGLDYASTVGLASAVSYESDRMYILSLPSVSTDTEATQTYVYNAFTKAWTRWTYVLSCGTINQFNDKLYLSKPGTEIIYQERKSFSDLDYYDPEYDITVVSTSGFTVTYTASIAPEVGDVIFDATNVVLKIVEINVPTSPYTVTVDIEVPATVTGAAVIRPGIPFDIEYNAWGGDNPALLKRVTQVSVLTDTIAQTSTATKLFVTFRTDIDQSEVERDIDSEISAWSTGPWGGYWGGTPGTQEYTTYVPKGMVYCRVMNLGVKHQVAMERCSIAGIAYENEMISERTSR